MSAVGLRVTATVAAMSGPTRTIGLRGIDAERRAALLTREWLVTNGLGGYASGTIGGAPSRRYHGLLIAALPPPYGRRLLLTDVSEELYVGGRRVAQLTARTVDDTMQVPLEEFRLEAGLPVWRYDVSGVVIEKRILMPHGQNTVHVLYELVGGADFARLDVTLAAHHRSHDAPVGEPLAERPAARAVRRRLRADDRGAAAAALPDRCDARTARRGAGCVARTAVRRRGISRLHGQSGGLGARRVRARAARRATRRASSRRRSPGTSLRRSNGRRRSRRSATEG